MTGDLMQKGKVNIAQGYPETLSNLKIFQETQKRQHPEKNLKTLADAIDFAIREASKVPTLEKRIKELEDEIERIELQHEVDMSEYDTGDGE